MKKEIERYQEKLDKVINFSRKEGRLPRMNEYELKDILDDVYPYLISEKDVAMDLQFLLIVKDRLESYQRLLLEDLLEDYLYLPLRIKMLTENFSTDKKVEILESVAKFY